MGRGFVNGFCGQRPREQPEVGQSEYLVPAPNTVGSYGFLMKYGTALDPVAAYRPTAGVTGIAVDASYYRMWVAGPVYASMGPRILVNGTEVQGGSWGRTHIPVGPGLHHVEVSTRRPAWYWRWGTRVRQADMGFADTVVPVAKGHSTPVYYRAPALHLFPGAIAPEPRRTPGMTWIRISWVLTASFVLLVAISLRSRFSRPDGG